MVKKKSDRQDVNLRNKHVIDRQIKALETKVHGHANMLQELELLVDSLVRLITGVEKAEIKRLKIVERLEKKRAKKKR